MAKKLVSIILAFLLSLSLLSFQVPSYVAQPIAPTVFQGENYETSTYPNGTVIWCSTPQQVYNGSSWVPYIFTNNTSSYTVQSGLVAAIFERGKVSYYNPSMTELAVGRENFLVYKWNDAQSKWLPVCASLQDYFISSNVVLGSSYVNITGVWKTSVGTLSITYHFEGNLKHTVTWVPNNAGKYAVVQAWNDTVYDQVKLGNNTVLHKTANAILGSSDSLVFTFFNNVKPFGIYESQISAKDYLHKVLFAKGSIEYQGISVTDAVAWIFYNATSCNLVAGQSLVIDPTTSTFNPPTYDSYVSQANPATNYGGDNVVYVTVGTAYTVKRGLYQFDISAIPAGATVTSASLNLYTIECLGSTTYNISRLTATFDESTVTWNTQPAFTGAGSVTFVKGASGAGVYVNTTVTSCFVVGATIGFVVKANDETETLNKELAPYAKEFPSTATELVVTYTLITIGEFQSSATVYANKYTFLNCTVMSPVSSVNLINATLGLTGGVTLLWDNVTDTFSEYSDPNNYATLDAGNSLRIVVNATSFQLCYRAKFNWTYPSGSVNVVSANTTVWDTSGSGSGSYTGLFTFQNNLIVSSGGVNDTWVNPSDGLNFTGLIYYQGTTEVPEDLSGILAEVDLNTTIKGSTSSINSTGGFSITISAEASPLGNYSYNLFAYTARASTTNQTVHVIVTKINVTITADTYATVYGTTVHFTWDGKYLYDLSTANVSLNILRNSSVYLAGLTSLTFTDMHATVGVWNYTSNGIAERDDLHGITSFQTNTITVTWAYWGGYINFYNESSPTWADWNMTEYNVDLYIYFSSGSVTQYLNLTTNPTSLTLSSIPSYAKAVITLPTSQQYSRTRLFGTGNLSFYLPDAGSSSVTAYTITLIDYVGSYRRGYFEAKYNGTVLFDGPFDVQAQYIAYLIEWKTYSITVYDQDYLYPFYFGYLNTPTSTSIQLSIANIQLPSGVLPIVWAAQWSGLNIAVAYNDSSASTSSVTVKIYNSTKSLLDTSTYTSSSFTALYAPVNTSIPYYVQLSYATSLLGSGVEVKPVTNATADWSMSLPDVFGLAWVVGSTITVGNIVAVAIILFSATLFTAFNARAGSLVVALEGLLFIYIQWLPATIWNAGILAAVVALLAIFGGEGR